MERNLHSVQLVWHSYIPNLTKFFIQVEKWGGDDIIDHPPLQASTLSFFHWLPVGQPKLKIWLPE
jgi:hypothetical protein